MTNQAVRQMIGGNAGITADLLRLFCGRGRVACVLTAYIDEGGSYPSTPSLTVGGCIARDTDWLRAMAEWDRVLCSYSVRAYRGVDCHQAEKDFKGWSRPRRDALVYDLITVLEQHRIGFFGSVLNVRDYEGLAIADQQLIGHPYGVCFEHSLERIDFIDEFKNEGPIAIVFEQAQKLTQHAISHYDRMKAKPKWSERLTSCSKAGKHEFVPLQCADLIAYWTNKVMCEKPKVDESFTLYTRPEFKRLSDTTRMRFVIFEASDLMKRVNEIRASASSA